jgi:hypothetical protein
MQHVCTDDQSPNATNEVEKEPEYDLDMGLLDEAQDHNDDHLMFTEESGNSYSLSLEPVCTYGENKCGYQFLSVPSVTLESVFMHTQMGQGAHGRNREDTTDSIYPDSIVFISIYWNYHSGQTLRQGRILKIMEVRKDL